MNYTITLESGMVAVPEPAPIALMAAASIMIGSGTVLRRRKGGDARQ
jgi:hypothetical protein